MDEKIKIMVAFFRDRVTESPIPIKSEEGKTIIQKIIDENLTINENFYLIIDGYFTYKQFKTVLRYWNTFDYPFYAVKPKGKFQDLIYQDYKLWSNNNLSLQEFNKEIDLIEYNILRDANKKRTEKP